mmetsp:Transcript_16319/g.29847  ORF Transcript_16319/g.29847 Transcript_16319/m.29847 type:complete len:224 (-) Transcript_16319:91-762(-)
MVLATGKRFDVQGLKSLGTETNRFQAILPQAMPEASNLDIFIKNILMTSKVLAQSTNEHAFPALKAPSVSGDSDSGSDSHDKLSKRRAQVAAASRKSRAKKKRQMAELMNENEALQTKNKSLEAENQALLEEVMHLRKKPRESDEVSQCSSVETFEAAPQPEFADQLKSPLLDEELRKVLDPLAQDLDYILSGVREDKLKIFGAGLTEAKRDQIRKLKVTFRY